MCNLIVKEGWNDDIHKRLLQDAANSLLELGVIGQNIVQEISKALE